MKFAENITTKVFTSIDNIENNTKALVYVAFESTFGILFFIRIAIAAIMALKKRMIYIEYRGASL